MEFEFQKSAKRCLIDLAESDKHSIILEGISGCGKTYLAKYFHDLKKSSIFRIVDAKVGELKQVIDFSYNVSDTQVICIENLDSGVDSSSQVLLKYLEEPLPYVYIVITTKSIAKLPETIRSRSISVHIDNPSKKELLAYGDYINATKFNAIRQSPLLDVAKSLNDISFVLSLDANKLKYYEDFTNPGIWLMKPQGTMSWDISHYNDNSKSNLSLCLRILYKYVKDVNMRSYILSSLIDLETKRYSETAILGNLTLRIKKAVMSSGM